MKIQKIMVVGAGQMGGGIAQVAAQSGIKVILNDIEPAIIERSLIAIAKHLDRLAAKGKIDAKGKRIFSPG